MFRKSILSTGVSRKVKTSKLSVFAKLLSDIQHNIPSWACTLPPGHRAGGDQREQGGDPHPRPLHGCSCLHGRPLLRLHHQPSGHCPQFCRCISSIAERVDTFIINSLVIYRMVLIEGTLLGLTNCIGSIPGFVAPSVASAIVVSASPSSNSTDT